MVQLPIDKKGFRQDANIIVEINAIEFPRPGTYEFIVKCEHEVIGETTIELVPV